ncbi:MAG: BrnT family toxin [Oscillospiraceae bacterium]|nr:BrnT family toxin [Oscillospiraceae bacterium]
MKEIEFTWDRNKNEINIRKHGVSFEEAVTVFYDPEAVLFDDPEHSYEEERFLIIGCSRKERICIVSHCYRENEEVIRIISARKATARECEAYHDWNRGE